MSGLDWRDLDKFTDDEEPRPPPGPRVVYVQDTGAENRKNRRVRGGRRARRARPRVPVVRRVAPRPDPDPDRDPFGSDFDNVVFSHEEVVMATPPRVRRPRRRRGGGNVAVVRRDLTPRLAMSRERWDQLIAFGLANGWIDSAYGVRWPFMNTYIVESTGYVGPVVGPFVVPVADVEGVVWRVGTVTHTMFNGFICCVQFAIGDHLYYVMVEVADGFVTAGAYVGDKSFGVMLNPQGGRDLYGFSVTN